MYLESTMLSETSERRTWMYQVGAKWNKQYRERQIMYEFTYIKYMNRYNQTETESSKRTNQQTLMLWFQDTLQSGLPASTLSHFSPHPHYSHRDQCSINWPYHSSAQNIPTASHVPKNKIQTYYHCIKESLHSDSRLPYPAILTIVPPPIKSPSPFPCHTLSPFWIFAHNSSLCLVQSLKMASQKFDHRLMFQDDNRNPSCYSQLNLPFLPQCPL